MSRRYLVPIAAAAAVVVLVGAAVATVNLGSDDTKPTSAAAVDRSPQERADRGERPSPSAEPSASPSPAATNEQIAAASPTTTTKSPTPTKTKTSTSPGVPSGNGETCKVSYYNTGSTTANGESFNPQGLTAAHKTLKFNTMIRVTNLANGKTVDVRINDRGPFVAGRCLDLAEGAFKKIASTGSGVITAKYEVLK